jgi:hypothetical protein
MAGYPSDEAVRRCVTSFPDDLCGGTEATEVVTGATEGKYFCFLGSDVHELRLGRLNARMPSDDDHPLAHARSYRDSGHLPEPPNTAKPQ